MLMGKLMVEKPNSRSEKGKLYSLYRLYSRHPSNADFQYNYY